MIYAVAGSGVTGFGNPHTLRGAFSINMATGQSTILAVFSTVDLMNLHGILMSVAWVLLLPLGSLIARHR